MKKRKKNKIKFKKVFIFLIIFIIISFSVYYLLNTKTKNIIIHNNDYYNDEVIIETAGIENYPRFLLLNTSRVKNKLKKLDLIEDVSIKKKWGFILDIDIKEKKILYYIRSNNEYMLSDNTTIKLDDVMGKPTLINYVPEDIESSFVKEFKKINNSVISLISEIEYSKTNYDEKRFIFYMNDGNLVFITVSKLDVMNKYISIAQKLDNKKGILYLDSGNYFEIKE